MTAKDISVDDLIAMWIEECKEIEARYPQVYEALGRTFCERGPAHWETSEIVKTLEDMRGKQAKLREWVNIFGAEAKKLIDQKTVSVDGSANA